jgi:hypothetical protein
MVKYICIYIYRHNTYHDMHTWVYMHLHWTFREVTVYRCRKHFQTLLQSSHCSWD